MAEQREYSLLLPFGYCNNAEDICASALACYNCSMFEIDAIDMEFLQIYLKKVEEKIKSLKIQGHLRQVELYENVRKSIIKNMVRRKPRIKN